MRLALRLALSFGLLAVASSAIVGVSVRARRIATETARFDQELAGVCERIRAEAVRQASADHALITGFCEGNELVEHVGLALHNGDLDGRRLSFASRVRSERTAFGVDELLVAIERGDIIGASPPSLLGLPARQVDELIRGPSKTFSLRASPIPAFVSRCTKPSPSGRLVGMVAARHVDPTMRRIADTLGVTLLASWQTRAPTMPEGRVAKAACRLDDVHGTSLPFEIARSTHALDENLREVDRTVGLIGAITAALALLVAIVLARSLGRPIADLAREAGKVASGEARPLEVRGSTEIEALGRAFAQMLTDLDATRRRLAAASRVAAWREVARRVAHEVKNPLVPIQAAVETLRRLRAREDPRFDEYFDEATRTVLDEVHRISTIVSEFTRFARLPLPRPQDIDVEDLARHIVQLHEASAGAVRLSYAAQRRAPILHADRDQLIQVMTNLVQNALDSTKAIPSGAVTLTTDADPQARTVAFTVTDNGAGVSPEIASRLFEPYATTKASGTGLGLAIAQRIALEHGGELSFLGPSATGEGAVFRLVLPLDGPPPVSDASGPASA